MRNYNYKKILNMRKYVIIKRNYLIITTKTKCHKKKYEKGLKLGNMISLLRDKNL